MPAPEDGTDDGRGDALAARPAARGPDDRRGAAPAAMLHVDERSLMDLVLILASILVAGTLSLRGTPRHADGDEGAAD